MEGGKQRKSYQKAIRGRNRIRGGFVKDERFKIRQRCTKGIEEEKVEAVLEIKNVSPRFPHARL
jgi:hypothetical protein